MKHGKILSALLSAAILFGAVLWVPVSGADKALTLKAESRLTLDREAGCIRGIYGEVTADDLAAEFDDGAVVAVEDCVLGGSDLVPSGAVVRQGEDELRAIIYGDVNRDGKINVRDIILLLQKVAGWDVSVDVSAGDAEADGKISLADVIAVIRWAAGWDVILGEAVYPAVDFELGDFSVVVPSETDNFENEAARLLCTALDSVYGTTKGNNRIITDKSTAELEIILGDTSRTKSRKAAAGLGEFDWVYDVQTKKSIVINAGDSAGLYEAVSAFLWDSFGYVNKYNRLGSYVKWTGSEYVTVEATKNVTSGTRRLYSHKTVCEELTLDGIPVEEYTVFSSNPGNGMATFLARSIKKACGKDVSIADSAGYNGGKAIFVKCGTDEHDPEIGTNTFIISADDDKIIIDAITENGILFAIRTFAAKYLSEFGEAKSDASIPARTLYGVDSNLLELTARDSSVYEDGSEYAQLEYTDAHGMPVKAYLLTVPNGASRIVMGTPDGDKVSGVSATVREQMESEIASGNDIFFGINADFFHIESDNSPQGLCVKDGNILKQNNENRPWIAVMKDGTLDCGIAGEARAKISNMQTGFGASHVLLRRGTIYQNGQGTPFGEIRHPRTAMGYDDNGCVYLIVVDGRQQEVSNGASLLDLSLMLKELGATYAVNLDGGGSSTMIENAVGELVVKNSPSDGALRSIFNSVLITK